MNYRFYRIIKFIFKPLFKIIFNPKVEGLDNIPKEGRVILAGNHKSNLDALIMIYAPNRIVHMMAKKELFSNFVTKWFFKSMCCISVNRNIHDEDAKKQALDVLNNDEVLGIFPEGTVNRTNSVLLKLKYGAVSFASKTNSKIVPFSLTGSYKKRSIKIKFGEPYKVSNDLEKENKILYDKIKELIEGEI